MAVVLDASSLLAYLHDEPGADVVEQVLGEGAVISIVNWTETLSKLADLGGDPAELAAQLEAEGLLGGLIEVAPLLPEDSVAIAQLRPHTREFGLGIGDHACIVTGLRLGVPVLTADRTWADCGIDGLKVELIR